MIEILLPLVSLIIGFIVGWYVKSIQIPKLSSEIMNQITTLTNEKAKAKK